MALARYESVAVNLAGDVIPNATVEVRRDQPGRPVAPLFSDREGTVPLGNPISTDSEGKFAFHAPGGVYYIRAFTGPSQQPLQQHVRRYQAIGTAAERDIEGLATALEAGTATFPTLAELEAFVPEVEGVGGKVTTGEDAGFYHYDTVEEDWIFDRPLYDTLARMTVTGGTADAVEASIDDGVPEASVIAFMIKPTLTNTGPLTINAKAVMNVNGDPMSAGEFPVGRWVTFTDEGASYQLTSDPAIDALLAQAIALAGETEAFRDEAEAFRDEAAGYAAGLNIPPVAPGDGGKILRAKDDETGSEWIDYASEAEAEAGLATDKPMNALRTAQAIAELSPQTDMSGLNLTTSILALQVADNTNVAIFGPSWIADSFDALTYVDVAGATNLDSSVAGLLKPTTPSGTSATPAGASGNAGFTFMDRSWSIMNSQTVKTVGVFSGTAGTYVVKIAKQNSAGNYDIVVSESFSHPGGGWADKTLSTPYSVPGSGSYYAGVYSVGGFTAQNGSGTARSFKSGDITGTGQTGFTEDSAGNVPAVRAGYATLNLTVRSASFSSSAVPTRAKALIRVKEVDAAVAGTDYTLECSRDAGTTWAAMTLSELFTSPSPTASIRVVSAAETDVSGQPSGSAPRWRFKTPTGKLVELHDVYFAWA